MNERISIVAYIERKADACDEKRADPKWGKEFSAQATIFRALASDIAAKLDEATA